MFRVRRSDKVSIIVDGDRKLLQSPRKSNHPIMQSIAANPIIDATSELPKSAESKLNDEFMVRSGFVVSKVTSRIT
eukprot:m.393311 g.393311  ORF g.393311 m.393311 type:complete len:76 (-) comp247956_c0_seq1:19-246(-)